ncbi:sialate O-acetylesterase [Prosthecobacter dejongeii]|uniref:Sialate O-acetylesterase n=1 Tax=Prosthecobacter dejongeii TaxID=48465 RepID=A0A7W7YQ08_9BACT|nr:sialate O-acetylesterase [Prosthecobacter dejongeii]MBB5040062.1 sialate O-acetylesterase [Prosthecobacter dejongeii]
MKRFLASLLILTSLPAFAEVTMPAFFTDGLVLQQGKPVAIWGKAAADENVSVTFAGQTKVTQADLEGKWRVTLDALPANATPAELTVVGKNTLTLKNILVGEVWLCSGQSNMQWMVSQSANPEQEMAAAHFPQIRMFSVERATAMEPAADVKGTWKEASPANVGQFSAVAYFFGRHLHQVLKVPVGLINTSWGGTRVEAWTSRESLEERPCAAQLLSDWEGTRQSYDADAEAKKFEAAKATWKEQVKVIQAQNEKQPASPKKEIPAAPRPTDDPNKTPHYPAVLFNAMVAPLIPYTLQGAIWYQGESNQKRAFQYQELLPNMINDWRTRWNEEFSFYIVQLASFGNGQPTTKDAGAADTWAELQEAQYLTAITLPKTGLAVINDIGEEKDIHPKNKQEVGRRLALWALAKDYGKTSTVPSGPLFKNSIIEGSQVRIQFDYAGGGLKTRDGGELKHFQIVGADQKWVWAQAKIEGQEIVVSSPQVSAPVGVRYAWAAWPEGANLINAEGLPASPFRTDEFILSTMGVTSPFQEVLKAVR